jgi:hypothetical protein
MPFPHRTVVHKENGKGHGFEKEKVLCLNYTEK